jgi:hypothetical protein
MEGTPRLAERGRRPFKPQTVLLRQMPAWVRTTSGDGSHELRNGQILSFSIGQDFGLTDFRAASAAVAFGR